jgi:hypothetical protein
MADKSLETKKTVISPISDLLASVSILLLSCVLLSNWSVVCKLAKEHPGLIGVLIAVAGEVFFDWREAKDKHARWKKFFMLLLVLSLAYELIEAREADRKTAEANERSKQLESSNLVLRSNIEELKKANLELEAQFAWRWCSPEQGEKLQAILRQTPDEVVMLIVIGDPETLRFAKQLSALFKNSGWRVSENSKTYHNIVVSGIFVPGETRAAKSIRAAFDAGGVEYSERQIPIDPGVGPLAEWGWGIGSPSENALRILVAIKPMRF